MRSIRVAAALALGGTLMLTTACGGGASGAKAGDAAGAAGGAAGAGSSAGAGAPAGATSAAPKTSAAIVDIEPKDGATNVAPDGTLKVSVTSGKLTQVTVTDKDGKAVDGTLAADGSGWVPAGPGLAVASTYKVSAQATDAKGIATTATSTFSTLTPTRTSRSQDNITTGATYGVGMIVSIDFGQSVKNQAAVEQAITVEASDGTVVKGHWFGNQRLDLRPQTFWKPGTKVALHFRLKNVETSPGVYGNSDRDESFTIGRSQISTVDDAGHEMTVQTDGQPTQTIPISSGSAAHPTYNGTMVIEAKEGTTRMTSASVPGLKPGEYDLLVPHAMRLTNSGTYVHGNNWSSHSTFGSANVSHGCVGLEDTAGDGSPNSSAGKFYAASLVGDVVKVVNSKGAQVAPDNGLSGWNMPWSTW
ncbi:MULTISPECIES: L,D-transpeptidase [unclassified Kitasatospora]|uniref:L,D-transpeptidase n=1 Tax=unclassified Kitasatospora TaxID=2633591 RepID=UPI002472F33C|nr:Ig-like domain-containing protein [Kitasatospora sp. MAP12-44]